MYRLPTTAIQSEAVWKFDIAAALHQSAGDVEVSEGDGYIQRRGTVVEHSVYQSMYVCRRRTQNFEDGIYLHRVTAAYRCRERLQQVTGDRRRAVSGHRPHLSWFICCSSGGIRWKSGKANSWLQKQCYDDELVLSAIARVAAYARNTYYK